MLLRTQLLRGLLALPLLAAMLIAQAISPASPEATLRIDAGELAALAEVCTDRIRSDAQQLAATWLLTSTPLDLPGQRRQPAGGCRRG